MLREDFLEHFDAQIEGDFQKVDAVLPAEHLSELHQQAFITDEVDLTDIVRPKWQPRQHRIIQDILPSIRQHGIQTPLQVRALGNVNGKPAYRLIAGERRLIAAEQIGLKRVPVRIYAELSSDTELELNLLENMQRRDLSAIEQIESLIVLLHRKLRLEPADVIRLIQQLGHPKRHGSLVTDQRRQIVEQVLETIGRHTIQTIRTKLLPLLKLSDVLKKAVRKQQIPGSSALFINRLPSSEQQQLLEEAIAQGLTRREIMDRIDRYFGKKQVAGDICVEGLRQSLDSTYNRAYGLLHRESDILQEQDDFKERLQAALGALDALLKDAPLRQAEKKLTAEVSDAAPA